MAMSRTKSTLVDARGQLKRYIELLESETAMAEAQDVRETVQELDKLIAEQG